MSMQSNERKQEFGVEIQVTCDSKGKGLFALRDFKNGDAIFEERPLISCQFLWNATYGYKACDFCLRPLETSEENARRLTTIPDFTLPQPECCDSKNICIRCPYCDVSYCSQECCHNAWNQFHESICLRSPTPDPNHPIVLIQEAWKQMHYPPETASIMLLVRILATVRQAKDMEGSMAMFMQFCHRTINEEEEIVHKLLGTEFQAQLETLRNMMTKVFSDDHFACWLTPNGFRTLVALVGTNGQGIGTSPLSRWVNNCDSLDLSPNQREKLDKFIDDLYEKLEKEAGCFLNTEGSGLYTLQSACNHSCEPNATATFPHNDFQLCLKALKDIKAGEEICLSYLDECNLNRSRHSRIKALRENYLFNCHCSKCESQADEPDVTSEEEMDSEDGDDGDTNICEDQ